MRTNERLCLYVLCGAALWECDSIIWMYLSRQFVHKFRDRNHIFADNFSLDIFLCKCLEGFSNWFWPDCALSQLGNEWESVSQSQRDFEVWVWYPSVFEVPSWNMQLSISQKSSQIKIFGIFKKWLIYHRDWEDFKNINTCRKCTWSIRHN